MADAAVLLQEVKVAKIVGDRRTHELAPVTIESGAVVVATLCGLRVPFTYGWGFPGCADCAKAQPDASETITP
jgi:hypothetical protein